MERPRAILIVGAGLGGLAAALIFARQGRPIRLFERFETPSEIGAGLQLSPNATRILDRLGLGGTLREAAFRPEAIELFSGHKDAPLARLPLGDRAERRWGAPYLTVGRAALHSVLWDAAKNHPNIELHTGIAIEDAGTDAVGARLSLGGGDDHWGHLLIGADGIHSAVRKAVPRSGHLRPTGRLAYRATISDPAMIERAGLSIEAIGAVLSPRAHLVAYPMGGGRGVNLVAFQRGRSESEGWGRTASQAEVDDLLQRIAPRLVPLADAADWQRWSVDALAGARAYVEPSGIALIGDAAHAMTPYAAQGAAMAIEDAAVLARCFDVWRDDPGTALRQYEAERRPRIAQVRRRGTFNHFVWHARFPVSIGRDAVLASRTGDKLMADFDWLYSFDAAR